MDRATGFYPVGWGFESLRAHFREADHGLVARLTATLTATALRSRLFLQPFSHRVGNPSRIRLSEVCIDIACG